MKINIEKRKSMIISTINKEHNIILLRRQQIQQVENSKYSGAI